MKKINLILALMLILPTVQAAITFTITPETQTAQPGQTFNVNLNANNDQPFWAFSAKIDESPVGPIAYTSNSLGTRLTGSLNGITQNTPDRITPYALFAGNTPGIIPGTGPLFTITYTVPQETTPGTYQLATSQLTVSDQNGNTIQGATIQGATITVQSTPPEAVVGYKLPQVSGNIEETVEVPICLSNTEENAVTGADITITHDGEIVKVTEVEILQGTGSSQITEGSTHVTITGLNVQNADCNAQTGANVAKIHYYLRAMGTSTLHVESATATPYSPQQFANHDGLIHVGSMAITKSCEPSQGVITVGQSVTIRYKVTNPSSPPNIGGVDEQDTYDNAQFTPTLPPVNNRIGSSLLYTTPAANTIRTVQTKTPQPFLNGPGTFTIYSINYQSQPAIPPATYNFGIMPPPPPALELSDENHNALTVYNVNCSVRVITSCTQDSDCDDGNFCNGQETCAGGQCQPGIPPNCDDGNVCHNNYCAENACHHDPIPGCTPPSSSGGGSGGGNQQYFTGCSMCDTTGFTDWECCGMDVKQIRTFCARPETYTHYCEQKGVKREMFAPQMPAQVTEAPAEEKPVVLKAETPAKVPGSKLTNLAGKATKEETTADDGLMAWIIGLIVLLILAGAFGAYTIARHKPSQPMPPIPDYTPMQPIPPAPMPAPIIVNKIKEAPTKVTAENIQKSPKKYDPYEAAIRRRLAKIMKKKK